MQPSAVEVLSAARRYLGFALPTNITKGLLYPVALTATLFLGPLYTAFLDDSLPFQRSFTWQDDVVEKFTSLTGIRTYVVVSQSRIDLIDLKTLLTCNKGTHHGRDCLSVMHHRDLCAFRQAVSDAAHLPLPSLLWSRSRPSRVRGVRKQRPGSKSLDCRRCQFQ